MNPLKAAVEVSQWLKEKGIRHFFIGGIALQYWGEPRLTRDVDVTVLVEPERLDEFLREALSYFRPRISNALEFARQHRMLLVETEDGVPVDISLGTWGYEEDAWENSKEVEFAGVGRIRLISAEDLIIHKCVAGRPRDLEDVESILVCQKRRLNLARIRYWLSVFREVVDTHDPLAVFETALQNAERALREGEQNE